MPAKSEKQRRAAGAALSAKRGKTSPGTLHGAAMQMFKSMSEADLKDFATKSSKVHIQSFAYEMGKAVGANGFVSPNRGIKAGVITKKAVLAALPGAMRELDAVDDLRRWGAVPMGPTEPSYMKTAKHKAVHVDPEGTFTDEKDVRVTHEQPEIQTGPPSEHQQERLTMDDPNELSRMSGYYAHYDNPQKYLSEVYGEDVTKQGSAETLRDTLRAIKQVLGGTTGE